MGVFEVSFSTTSGSRTIKVKAVSKEDAINQVTAMGEQIIDASLVELDYDSEPVSQNNNIPFVSTAAKYNKDPWLAFFLDLLAPGIGHVYAYPTGESTKKVVFGIVAVILLIRASVMMEERYDEPVLRVIGVFLILGLLLGLHAAEIVKRNLYQANRVLR